MKTKLHFTKRLIAITLFSIFAFKASASITTGSVSGTYQCGSTISVNYSSTEPAGTTYRLQISIYADMRDMLGPLHYIGEGSSPITGSLASVPAGTYYARVIGLLTGPVTHGSVSGPFTVGAPGSNLASAINAGTISCNVYSNTKTNSSTYCFANNYDVNQNANQLYGQPSKDVWYKFTISSASSISISTCSSSLNDTYVHLLNSDGSHRESRDDNGPICTPSYRGSLLYSDLNFLPAGTYYVVVEGYSTYEGSITTTITGICPAPVMLDVPEVNQSKALTLQLAPNPFSNSTTLKIAGGTGTIKLQVTAINGAVVYTNNVYNTSEPLTLGEDLPAGIYFVRINDNSESKILKLVKVN